MLWPEKLGAGLSMGRPQAAAAFKFANLKILTEPESLSCQCGQLELASEAVAGWAGLLDLPT